MKRQIKNLFRRGFPRNRNAFKNSSTTYSQLGEDVLIRHLLKKRRLTQGYYIDIGCFEPIRYSNTYSLYLSGFSGIGIDPNPDLIPLWEKYRPRDCFLCAAITPNDSKGEGENKLSYLCYPDRPACNTITSEVPHDLPEGIRVEPVKLMAGSAVTQLAKEKKEQECVLLDIDCEGMDIDIIRSIDLNELSPHIINLEASDPGSTGILDTMIESGYTHRASLLISHLFERDSD